MLSSKKFPWGQYKCQCTREKKPLPYHGTTQTSWRTEPNLGPGHKDHFDRIAGLIGNLHLTQMNLISLSVLAGLFPRAGMDTVVVLVN